MVAVAVLNRFWHKARELGKPVTKFLLEKNCVTCKGSGQVACSTCGGKGSVKKVTIQRGKCSICGGLGYITPPCPNCSATGVVRRPLRYEDRGAQANVQQRGIWWWAKWFQLVVVSVRNLDDKAGWFTASVTLQDANRTTKQGRTLLMPGQPGQVPVEFEISNGQGFATQYAIAPEEMQFGCTICSGSGKIQKSCNGCQGTGEVPEQREIAETCSSCAGAGKLNCKDCNGTGIIRRI